MPNKTQTTVQTYTHWLDVGNYSVQAISAERPNDILTIRSLTYPLTFGEAPLTSKRNEHNPLMVYNGRAYHAGEAALSYRNGSEATVKGEKTRLEKQVELMLATIQPWSDTTLCINLVMTVPNPYEEVQELDATGNVISVQAVGDLLTNGLTGAYQFMRNGHNISLTVECVTVVQEGLPAVLKARRDGSVPNHGITVCLDLGGGTANTLLVDDAGDVLGYMSLPGMGGVRLASAIRSNELFQKRCKRAGVGVPSVERVMSAIAAGKRYAGNNVVAHWEDIFVGELTRWYGSLIGDVELGLGDLGTDVTALMMTGGNANLLREYVDTDVFIPSNAEAYNITALKEMNH